DERDGRQQFELPRAAGLAKLRKKQGDESQAEWHQNSEIEEPKLKKGHFEFSFVLGPTWMQFENGAGLKMIGRQPNEKCRWNQSAEDNRQNMAANLWVARNEETGKHKAQGDEGVKMKERH